MNAGAYNHRVVVAPRTDVFRTGPNVVPLRKVTLTKNRNEDTRRTNVDQVSDHTEGVRVLIVDDDPALRALVQRCIAPAASHVDHADDGESALAMLANNPTDLVILDLELPRMNGLEVLMRVRRESDMPVIVLSGRGDESDRVLGLDLGADDYIVKPFLPRELLSRVRAVTRRSVRATESGPSRAVIVHGPITIDRASRECFYDNGLLTLTAKEFDLLAHLAGSPRRVISREELLESVWGSSSQWQDPATVTEHVRRLRNRIEGAGGDPSWLRTVRGQGYVFAPEWRVEPRAVDA